MKNIFARLMMAVVPGAILLIAQRPVCAEGPQTWAGANGANRVVETNQGFIGVQGQFDAPSFFIPVWYVANDPQRPFINQLLIAEGAYQQSAFNNYLGSVPGPTTSYYNNNSNRQNSKPSMYLGSTKPEVDAGLQWEWLPLGTAPPGWSAFIRGDVAGNVWSSPLVSEIGGGLRGPYRAGPGTQNPGVQSFHLSYLVGANAGPDRGQVFLKIDLLPAGGKQNPTIVARSRHNDAARTPLVVYQPTQLSDLSVKRVTAITQRAAAILDGSSMHNATFRYGQVATLSGSNVVWTRDAAGNPVWSIGNVSNGSTGYIPGRVPTANGWPNGDKDQANPRNFMIDFPSLTQQALSRGITAEATIRANWHNGYDPNNTVLSRRYTEERVNINLQTSASVRGAFVQNRILPRIP
jgi:hypothetical protein